MGIARVYDRSWGTSSHITEILFTLKIEKNCLASEHDYRHFFTQLLVTTIIPSCNYSEIAGTVGSRLSEQLCVTTILTPFG